MTNKRRDAATLQVASLLIPGKQRAEWLDEWRSELWYVPEEAAMLFCLGSFRDALSVRRSLAKPEIERVSPIESPMRCLALLAAIAVVALVAIRSLSQLLAARTIYGHISFPGIAIGCLATLALSCLLSPALLPSAASGHGCRAGTVRRSVFLVFKVILLQPALLCALLVWILIAPIAPIAGTAIFGAWILTLRWIFTDQQRRCPTCLRLLTGSVRIGSSAQTFLELYGDQSICPSGHGWLYVPGTSPAYTAERSWLGMGESWQ